jgi:hypothetical protein
LNLNLRFRFTRFDSRFKRVWMPELHIIDSYRCVTLKVVVLTILVLVVGLQALQSIALLM